MECQSEIGRSCAVGVYDTLLETKTSYPHGYIATRLELKQVYLKTGTSQVIPTGVGNTQSSPNRQNPASCLTPTVRTYSSFLPLRLAPIKGITPGPGHVLKADMVPRGLVGSTPIKLASHYDSRQNNLLSNVRSQVQPSRIRNVKSSLHKPSTFQRVGFNRPAPLISSSTKFTSANVKNRSLNSRSKYTHGQNSSVTALSDADG